MRPKIGPTAPAAVAIVPNVHKGLNGSGAKSAGFITALVVSGPAMASPAGCASMGPGITWTARG